MSASLGIPSDEVWLVPYDPDWPRLFELEASRIQAACGSLVREIVHVGSTAVPGLAAKPIIDLMVGVEDFADAGAVVAVLERLGYRDLGAYGVPGRIFLRYQEPCTHHVQLTEVDSPFWHDELLFRDVLREDADTAARYEILKSRLATEHHHDRPGYTAAKTDFITEALASARA